MRLIISLLAGLLFGLGLIVSGFSILYLGVYLLRFKLTFSRFRNDIIRSKADIPDSFSFSYDDKRMVRKSKAQTSETLWEALSHIEMNGNDMYLYLKSGSLHDIISSRILGDVEFQAFKEVALAHFEHRS